MADPFLHLRVCNFTAPKASDKMPTTQDSPDATGVPLTEQEVAHSAGKMDSKQPETTNKSPTSVSGAPQTAASAENPVTKIQEQEISATSAGSNEKEVVKDSAASSEAPMSETTTLHQPPADQDIVNPPDFQGEVQTNNDLPTQEDLHKIENYTVVDRDGRSHPFKSLYSGRNVARRVLLIFVRHFFCDNCQAYLRTLSASITPNELLSLPVSTFVAVIGCGSHKLIDAYVKETGCPFPIYADPTRRLYSELGMVRTLTMGARPAYLEGRTFAHTMFSGIRQGLKQIHTGLATKKGDLRQVGGEFLFEPAAPTLDTPISSPVLEVDRKLEGGNDKGGAAAKGAEGENREEGEEKVEEKRVTWCHRMRTTRDHAEIPELREILGLEGDGVPTHAGKRWESAVKSRKGTGLSMASQMGRPSAEIVADAGSK